jgi:hypothetical protein
MTAQKREHLPLPEYINAEKRRDFRNLDFRQSAFPNGRFDIKKAPVPFGTSAL